MRSAGLVALGVAALALALGLARMNDDIDAEVEAAMTLADAVALLARPDNGADEATLRDLAALQSSRPLRHLRLTVRDADQRPLLEPPPEPPAPGWLRVLLALHRDWLSPPDTRQARWTLQRPDGRPWTVTLAASHDSERREAMVSLLGMLALLLGCITGLLIALRANLARALAPLARLVAAIGGIERQDLAAVRALPEMPIAELETLAAALRHLAEALEQAEAERRRLARQVLTLQEDERSRLARELHDELGQRLTAMRVDAAWLGRHLADRPPLREVVDGMAAQCERVQQDVRALLRRLEPFDRDGEGDGDSTQPLPAGEPLARLVDLLRALADGWSRAGGGALAVELALCAHEPHGDIAAWPAQARLPRPLALALFRLSQEALTNVARHAAAGMATLTLALELDAAAPAGQGAAAEARVHKLLWRVDDDGVGCARVDAAAARGNGLAAMRERVWALGGTLELAPVRPGSSRPGLRVSARFELDRLEATTR